MGQMSLGKPKLADWIEQIAETCDQYITKPWDRRVAADLFVEHGRDLIEKIRQLSGLLTEYETRVKTQIPALKQCLTDRDAELAAATERAEMAERERDRLAEWQQPILGLVKSFPDYASRDWTGDKEGWGFVFELLKGIHRERDKLKTQVKYERLFPEIVDVARQHGYVIGLHGSLQRDCDLIAVPWTFPVKTPDELIEAIREKVGGTLESSEDGRERSLKPWGRIAWSIQVGGGRYLDVSVFQLDVNRVYLEAHEEKALRQMAEVKLKQQAAELAELRAVVERATSAVDHTGQVTGMCFGSPTAAESTPSNPASPRWSGCGRCH